MECLICENIKDFKNDPYFIMELETGHVTLGWYQRFKGYTIFACKKHAADLHELETEFKLKYLEEMAIVAEAVFNVYKADKMNYELLGNGIAHLHWHLIPRVDGDTPFKGPIWWLKKEELFDEATRPNEKTRKEMIKNIKNEINRLLQK